MNTPTPTGANDPLNTPLGPNVVFKAQRKVVQFVQGLYSIWSKYQWDKDPAVRRINILQAPVDTEDSALTRPSVLISFGNVRTVQGDSSPGGIDVSGEGDWLARFSFYLPILFTCVAPNEVEANTIAYYLFRGIQEFRHVLIQHGEIGAISSNEGLRLALPVGERIPFASADWYAASINTIVRVDDVGNHLVHDKSGTIVEIESVLNRALEED